MWPINIYFLTRFSSENDSLISDYKAITSYCQNARSIKKREYETLCCFVDAIQDKLSILDFDGFYFSYTIPQINKEFDLLKISEEKVVNIELKSEEVPLDNILQQLLKNKHYLSHLPGKHHFFTYIQGLDKIYTLSDDDELSACSIDFLFPILCSFDNFFSGNLDKKFRASQFLVSPVNTPEKFLMGKYFLTLQQQEISEKVEKIVEDNHGRLGTFVCISGSAGTGKTLLLYHLAKKLANNYRVCIFHCGPLSDNHRALKQRWSFVTIIMPKALDVLNISQYDIFFVDESQRIYPLQLEKILEEVQIANKVCILGIDPKQVMSNRERNYKNYETILQLPNISIFNLSKRIRTNKELANFIEKMLDAKKDVSVKQYENIEVCYAENYEEAKYILDYYHDKNYQYISYTRSLYEPDAIDFLQSEIDTHHAIGQEFDSVVITLDNRFCYNENQKLVAHSHPNPDYIFGQLFYQGVTRAREKLAIVVIDNLPVFSQIVSILKASNNI